MYPGPVTFIYLANSFLPSDFDGYTYTLIICIFHTITFRPGEYNLSFPVLVVQINVSRRVELPKNGRVPLVFDIPEVVKY